MKINVNALTEKGVLKPGVRSQIAGYVSRHRGIFANATKIEGKNTYVQEITDANDNTIYVAFDVVITEKNPANRSVKKPSAKASEAVVFEFEAE